MHSLPSPNRGYVVRHGKKWLRLPRWVTKRASPDRAQDFHSSPPKNEPARRQRAAREAEGLGKVDQHLRRRGDDGPGGRLRIEVVSTPTSRPEPQPSPQQPRPVAPSHDRGQASASSGTRREDAPGLYPPRRAKFLGRAPDRNCMSKREDIQHSRLTLVLKLRSVDELGSRHRA